MLNGPFNNPAFQMEALTASLLNIPMVPTQVRSLGIFESGGIATTSIDLEYNPINASLIPFTQRGEPATRYRAGKRNIRNFRIPHLLLEATIVPSALQNVRQFGTTSQLRTATSAVTENLTGMALSHDMTLEHISVGAVKGVITDSDGSTVLYDLFAEFGISQTSIDFNLGNADEDIVGHCLDVKRDIQLALGGIVFVGVYCFAGDAWFDAFVAHPKVADAYKLWQDRDNRPALVGASGQMGDFLRSDNRSGFTFAGITFVNYVGSVNGVDFFPSAEAHFFPVGVPQLFKTSFAPADTMSAVNTEGLPRYAMGEPIKMGRGLELQTESNPLSYCSRPKTLVKGTTST